MYKYKLGLIQGATLTTEYLKSNGMFVMNVLLLINFLKIVPLISLPYPLSTLLVLVPEDGDVAPFPVRFCVCAAGFVFDVCCCCCRCKLLLLLAVIDFRFCSSKLRSFFFSRVNTFGNEKNGTATSKSNKPHNKNPPHHMPTHRRSPGSK